MNTYVTRGGLVLAPVLLLSGCTQTQGWLSPAAGNEGADVALIEAPGSVTRQSAPVILRDVEVPVGGAYIDQRSQGAPGFVVRRDVAVSVDTHTGEEIQTTTLP
jgi:hypothetical protein